MTSLEFAAPVPTSMRQNLGPEVRNGAGPAEHRDRLASKRCLFAGCRSRIFGCDKFRSETNEYTALIFAAHRQHTPVVYPFLPARYQSRNEKAGVEHQEIADQAVRQFAERPPPAANLSEIPASGFSFIAAFRFASRPPGLQTLESRPASCLAGQSTPGAGALP